MTPKDKTCCTEFRRAMETGTDNEGYGRLINRSEPPPYPYSIGCRLSPIEFCPWCGADVKEMPQPEQPDMLA